jgi:lipoprotein-releasing system permease protein
MHGILSDLVFESHSLGGLPDPQWHVVDLYESKMSEYDSSFVFVPIRKLQEMRGHDRPHDRRRQRHIDSDQAQTGRRRREVRDLLRRPFRRKSITVQTWRDKQGPLLAAVQLETAILNVLLFLIIAVAGFGILAIFFMIVVEKTRDIGILKALGAPSRGVMGIFLGYGCRWGWSAPASGWCWGCCSSRHINEIADRLERVTGRPIFDPSIYYFREIPTIVELHTCAGGRGGPVLIAVLASVLPARRAARLHPVEALRYE